MFKAPSHFKKIILFKLASIGDVLVSTPFFRLIKERYPDTEIHHLVMKHCAMVTENNPYVDKQIIVDILPSGSKYRDLKIVSNLIMQLRKEKYDMAIIFHRSFYFQLIAKLAGIKHIIGFKSTLNLFLDHYITYRIDINRTIQDYNLLKTAGIDIEKPEKLEFYIDYGKINRDIVSSLPQKFIACNPGGGNPHAPADNKIWPPEYYAELIDSSPLPIVLLGRGEKDLEIERKIKLVARTPVISFINRTNFYETAYIIKQSVMYIGNDSSLLFLASALDKPSLGIYGPTQAFAFNPLGKKQYTIESPAPCAPCYNPYEGLKSKMYTCKDNICMKSITVESVVEKMLEILRQEGAI